MGKGFVKMKSILNQDKSLVEDIRKRLKENNGYCPCAINQNDDTKCMCKDFREQNHPGECHCGLYVKIDD